MIKLKISGGMQRYERLVDETATPNALLNEYLPGTLGKIMFNGTFLTNEQMDMPLNRLEEYNPGEENFLASVPNKEHAMKIKVNPSDSTVKIISDISLTDWKRVIQMFPTFTTKHVFDKVIERDAAKIVVASEGTGDFGPEYIVWDATPTHSGKAKVKKTIDPGDEDLDNFILNKYSVILNWLLTLENDVQLQAERIREDDQKIAETMIIEDDED